MSTSKAPHEYQRRILLCVSGMTPQIVTETLQALLEQTPPFVPTEIRVLTTVVGRDTAQKALLEEGRLAALCAEYGRPAPPLDFTLITDSEDTPLADIRNDTDNAAAADCILAVVRKLAQDDTCAIHASLAGGRKTMSHYMGYALSLFGRAQDRLSHVLVTPEDFESAREFFHRPHEPRCFTVRDRQSGAEKTISTADACIELADIPLLRLGDALPRQLRDGHTSFSETVRLANLALAEPELILDEDYFSIRAGGILIELSALHFSLLYWLAKRVVERKSTFQASCIDDELFSEFFDTCSKLGVQSRYLGNVEALRAKPPVEKDRENFYSRTLSKLRSCLEKQLGAPLAARYLPDRNAPVRLQLTAEQIRFEALPEAKGKR